MKAEFNIYARTGVVDENDQKVMDLTEDEETGEVTESQRLIAYSDRFSMEAEDFGTLISNMCERFGITEAQCAQEIADNLARRCSNGTRMLLRDIQEQDDLDEAKIQQYVADWKPGRKAEASLATQLKKKLKNLDPESRANAEDRLKSMLDELGI